MLRRSWIVPTTRVIPVALGLFVLDLQRQRRPKPLLIQQRRDARLLHRARQPAPRLPLPQRIPPILARAAAARRARVRLRVHVQITLRPGVRLPLQGVGDEVGEPVERVVGAVGVCEVGGGNEEFLAEVAALDGLVAVVFVALGGGAQDGEGGAAEVAGAGLLGRGGRRGRYGRPWRRVGLRGERGRHVWWSGLQ